MTPLYARVGRKLIDSLPHETVVRSRRRARRLPDRASRLPGGDRAGSRERGPRVRGNPLVGRGLLRGPAAERYGGVRHRQASGRLPLGARAASPPAQAFASDPPDRRRDWLVLRQSPLAATRVDRPARRRRRPAPRPARPGDAYAWRSRSTSGASRPIEPDRLLRLHAEMKLPGRAWLAVRGRRRRLRQSLIRQTAIFHPTGLLGTVYWYGLFPVHSWIFRDAEQDRRRCAVA